MISFSFIDGQDTTNNKQDIQQVKLDLNEIKLALLKYKNNNNIFLNDTIKSDTINNFNGNIY